MTRHLKALAFVAVFLAGCYLYETGRQQQRRDYYNLSSKIIALAKAVQVNTIDRQIHASICASKIADLDVVDVRDDGSEGGLSTRAVRQRVTVVFEMNRPLTEAEHHKIITALRRDGPVLPGGNDLRGVTGDWRSKLEYQPYDPYNEESESLVQVSMLFSSMDH